MGELLAFLSACCFAASNVTVMRGINSTAENNGAFLSILMTTVIACTLWVGQGISGGWTPLNGDGVLWFAGAGVLTIFIGRVFLYASVQHLGAVRASAVKRLNPLFSVVLGVVLLGEAFDYAMLAGLVLIGASFGVLIRQSLQAAAASATSAPVAKPDWRNTLGNLGFFYGPVSALAYAFGYVGRKQGLLAIPDAAFGTMLGSMVGALVFVIMARFVDSYRVAVRQTFTKFNGWLWAAGLLSSAGQLLYFGALSHTTISRAAMISSMEAFVSIFLTVVFTRSVKHLTGATLLAVCLGVAGTLFIVVRW